MPRRRVRHRPALANGIDGTANNQCAVADKVLSTNSSSLCTKRRRCSQLSVKSQQSTSSDDCAVNASSQYGENASRFKQSTANNDQSVVTSPDQQQLPDDTPNAALQLGQRLLAAFYDQPCVELARNLLGKYVVRISSEDGKRLSGRIVETEAYVGTEDRASHSYGGRRTARNEAMYMPSGTSYVYNIYGIYTCINISGRGDSYH